MSSKISRVENFTKILFNLIFALLFLSFVPVTVILLSPFFIYRWIISRILCRMLYPELDNILSAQSTFYTTGAHLNENLSDSCKTPLWSNIILILKIQGQLDYDSMVAKLVGEVGMAAGKNGKLLYPQFHQYCVPWAGYLFWKWEKGDQKTRAEQHIRTEKIKEASDFEDVETYVQNFSNHFLSCPFKAEKSPWEVVFLESSSMENPLYFVLFKFHHSLCDGCSIFNVMIKCVDNPVKMTLPRSIECSGPCQKGITVVGFPFKAAYDFARVTREGLDVISPWGNDCNQLSGCRNFGRTKTLPIETLRNTAEAFGVSLSAVVLASLAGGIGNYLKNDFPEGIMCQMPVPIPNHPDGLTNSFSLVSLCLPASVKNLSDRLKLAENTIKSAKSSLYSATVYTLGKIFGSLPQFILNQTTQRIQPLQLSIFPGPRTLMTFRGQPVQNMSFTAYGGKLIPIIITLLSYNGGIEISLNVDDNLFPSKTGALQNLIVAIEEEFERSSCQHSIQIVHHSTDKSH